MKTSVLVKTLPLVLAALAALAPRAHAQDTAAPRAASADERAVHLRAERDAEFLLFDLA